MADGGPVIPGDFRGVASVKGAIVLDFFVALTIGVALYRLRAAGEFSVIMLSRL